VQKNVILLYNVNVAPNKLAKEIAFADVLDCTNKQFSHKNCAVTHSFSVIGKQDCA